MTAGTLRAAHDDLLERTWAAEKVGDWSEACVLEALVEVADYMGRIAEVPGSHYRAEKVVHLAEAADAARRRCFAARAAGLGAEAEAHIDATADVAAELDEALVPVLWAAADGRRLEDHERRALRRAARRFLGWADSTANEEW